MRIFGRRICKALTATALALSILTACGGTTGEPKDSDIPDDAFLWGGHYYYVFDNCDSWESAERYCESLGGHLAVITSAAENQAVYSYIRSIGLKSAFFGYAKNVKSGSWYWVDGTQSNYKNWHSGEPNNEYSSEYYAMFYYKFTDGTWNDGNFDWHSANGVSEFICEWD